MIQNFNRVEKKYIIDKKTYKAFINELSQYMYIDKYSKTTICNIYFDTDDYAIIRHSLDKPSYKEKLRVRSYGTPKIGEKVFVEIKKKFNGVVYKRRIRLPLDDFYHYFYNNKELTFKSNVDKQIFNEIDYFIKKYKVDKETYISYVREAYIFDKDPNFRVTFDTAITYRTDDTKLESGSYGKRIMDDNYIMEVKTLGAMPLWFVRLLSKYEIYPNSFSKYGEVYKKMINDGEI